MFYKSKFSGLRIKTKLRLLNLFICIGFFLIICITFVSFIILRNLSLEITTRETKKVIASSEITRQLSKLFYDIDHLSNSFYGKNDYLKSTGNRLTGTAESIAAKSNDPALKTSLTDLTTHLDSLISQCAAVNTVLHAREVIDLETQEELSKLEYLISDLLIQSTFAGEDTSYAEQLLTLVMVYRESVLQIGKLHAELAYEHYSTPLNDKTCPIIVLIDDLLLRVQTITASIPDIARHGEKIVHHVRKYRETVVQLHTVMMELSKRKTDLNHSKLLSMSVMENIEKNISESTELTRKQIEKILFMSGLAVILLSITVIIILVFTTAYLIRTNINIPMSTILSGIKSFGGDNLESRIVLDNNDEWSDIGKGLNKMASDLRKTYAALRDSEERFRELAELLPQPVFETDIGGTLTYSNKSGFETFGYRQEDFNAGLSIVKLFTAENKKKADQSLEKIHKEGAHFEVHEFTGLKKDGSIFPVLVYLSQIIRENKIDGARGIVVDITERKRIEEALIENELFLNSVIENIPNMIFVKDAEDLRFVRLNNAGEELLGYSRDELIGKSDYDFFSKEEADFFTGKDHEVLKSKKLLDIPEEKIQTKNKGTRTLHTKKFPILDKNGIPLYLLGVSEDITDFNKAKEDKEKLKSKLHMAQKMEAIGLMAGGVAHDLNNILSGIIGYPELLLMQLPEDSKLRRPIEAILQSGKRATEVVDDLLTVARGVAATREITNINTLVNEYLDSPEYKKLQAYYPNITGTAKLDSQLLDFSCSPIHIKKCLMNLVTNGEEAIIGKGEIVITTNNLYVDNATAHEHKMQSGEYVILGVQDSGPGLLDEELEHIFEPFYTKKKMGRSGTGLGLAIVWNTVQDHGGTIVVNSDNQGTCFTLSFPASRNQEARLTENPETENLFGHNEHILVVDDEPQLQDIASQMLKALGYKVDSVCSGELAIEFIKENPVALIVLDMLMEPGITGRQTYEEIIKLHPDQKAIIVSGFSESDDVKEALRLGAGSFIKKPYSMDQLGRAIKEVLGS